MTEQGLDKGKDNRKVERKYLVFYLRVFEGLSVNVLGHVVNISSEGIMLLSDGAIPVNQEYHLRMRIPSEVSGRGEIVFNATSRWCSLDKNPDFYLTGFHIHDLKAEEKKDILCLIDEFSFIDN